MGASALSLYMLVDLRGKQMSLQVVRGRDNEGALLCTDCSTLVRDVLHCFSLLIFLCSALLYAILRCSALSALFCKALCSADCPWHYCPYCSVAFQSPLSVGGTFPQDRKSVRRVKP